ncbi:MAG: EamA family transporter [Pseudomonadota bacterium]
MPFLHLLLALAVAAAWAFNFVAIKVGLAELPPIFMAAMRFVLTALPAVFFIRPPKAPVGRVLMYGLFAFAGQFGFLFASMAAGMPPALAALTLQLQVFVTIALAALLYRERVGPVQLLGAAVAAGGIGLIAANTGGDVTVAGLLLGLTAACCWGIGNMVGKSLGKVDMLALVVWASLAVPLPLMALSLLLEGPQRIVDGLHHVSMIGALSVAYIAYASTLLAYTGWTWLMARHPASTVAPFTLLVPPLAGLFSALTLHETFPGWKLAGGALVLAGVVINLAGPRLLAGLRAARAGA